jgi:hypothetical protein
MLTLLQINTLFHYSDGQLIWKVSPCNSVRIGDVAGFERGPYLALIYMRKKYMLHRIIFLLHHGFLPDCIDHIDRDKRNNRIENLRQVTFSQNQMNRGKQKNNTSGFKGVSWHSDISKWGASIKIDKKQKHLGYFQTAEAAYQSYLDSSQIFHGIYRPIELGGAK